MIDWEQFRRGDGSINLVEVYLNRTNFPTAAALEYLEWVDDLQRIKSRQAAAIAIATARTLRDD